MALNYSTIYVYHTSDVEWSTGMPVKPGLYLFRCGENDDLPDVVAITERDGEAWVHDQDVGINPLSDFHNNLTNISWKHIA